MSIGLALGLIALLLSLWAINWASRAANAAERAAAAAEKSAIAAGRTALAAQRRTEAAATTPAEPTGDKHEPNYDASARARTARLDALVKELMDAWPQEKSAWHLIERNPTLADDEVEDVIEKALYLMGHTDDEAKQHAAAVLSLRHDNKNV